MNSRFPSSPVVLHTRVVTGAGGGPDKTILNSPRFLKNAGYRTLCAYMRPPDDPVFAELRHKAKLWEAELIEVDDRGPWDWQVFAEFLKICRKEKVTIWHGHDYKSNALGLILKQFHPMRLVTTVHGWVTHTSRTPFYYQVDRFCLPRYDKVICVSEDLYRAARASGVPKSRCVLIENAIDTVEFHREKSPSEAKVRQGFSPERQLIGAVGRLSAEKGFDLLIRAVDQLLQQGLNLELIIIGEGSEKPQLESLITQLGRQNQIHLLGYQANVKNWYEAMDVFALSSLREGLPNVLLEAMALEVPVVATRIAGVPRLIDEEVNGLLVEPGSVSELTKKLQRLLMEEDLRNRLAQAGRERVETRHSFSVRMQKIQALYDSLLRPPR